MINLENSRSFLLSVAHDVEVAFVRSGYAVQRPMFIWSANPLQNCAQITVHSQLGADGVQDAHIEFSNEGICKVFVGEAYSVHEHMSSKTTQVTPWKRAELLLETPELEQVLLRKVRAMLLED